ncbi:hypothetical protein [Chitinophaga sp. Cy-1792]|uniref:hypothetical protein n=1 Tax=Chitinophaga sp. Cy-1792 TaxID=2608339 RepID=UPI00142333E1|nr:hypothetical protein [Chitinophaga sp. Cy-1792]NIG55660.1 hypothetical protein [Chitinophaga sp. Cy-1792]
MALNTAVFLPVSVLGQQATISIGTTELSAGHAGVTVPDIGAVGAAPRLILRSEGPTLTGASGEIPLSQVRVTPVHNNTEQGTVFLSQRQQEIRLTSIDPSGAKYDPVFVRFDIANLSGYAWKAGKYRAELNCGISNGEGKVASKVITTALQVNVDPVIAIQRQPTVIRLHINEAQQYINGYVSPGFDQLGITHTVPLNVKVSTDAPFFSYTGNNGKGNTRAAVSGLHYRVDGAGATGPVALSTSGQQVYAHKEVPVGNQTDLAQRFTISAEDLQKYFSEPGTYRTNLNIQVADEPAAPAITKTIAAQLEIVVDEVMAFDAGKIVNLSIQTMDDYKNGVYAEMYRHLILTGNITANLTVRSLNANFTSLSGSFPVGYLTVGPYLTSSVIRTVQVSTSDQLLIQRYNPNGTTYISLKYSILADKTRLLISKPKEQYSVTLIYSAVPY